MDRSLALLSFALGACLASGGCDRDGARVVDRAEDAASVPVGQTSARVVGGNLSSALMGDLYEVQAANIALERSENEAVRTLAQEVRTEQAAGRRTLEGLAAGETPSLVLPGVLDQRRRGLIDNLRKAVPADFDKVYLDQLIAAHEEALTLNRSFADHSDAPGLVKNALTLRPQIEARPHQARNLRRSLPG
ncbi:hypothetical protein D3C86_273760 [compost metagenome]